MIVIGLYVNVILFEDVGVDMFGEGVIWDDWVVVLMEVKDNIGIIGGLVIDCIVYWIVGFVFSYGVKFFDDVGELIFVDDGFCKFVEIFVSWYESGLMFVEGWLVGFGI